MNAAPEISIILPVHNAEKHLRACIESVIAQTASNFELIIIDDGSSDKTPEICEEYAKKDERIILIRQKKSGVSAARNAGLDIARGSWIGFVDGDDRCNPNMFQILHENAVNTDADVSVCAFNEFNENENTTAHYEYELNQQIQIFNSAGAVLEMLEFDSFGGYSWNKLVKFKLFSIKEIRYDVAIQTMSDVFLFYQIFKCSEKIVYSPVKLYNYIQVQTSIVHAPSLTKRLTGLSVWDKILSLETDEIIKKKVFMRKVDYASRMCYEEVNRYSDELYAEFRKTALKNILYLLFCVPISLKSKLSRCFCILFPKIFMRFQKLYRGVK